MDTSPLAFLRAAQSDDGGWGYTIRGASTVEPTAATVLALRDDPASREASERGLAWLRGGQHADGGWGMSRDDPESGWHTAWAVLALAPTGAAEQPVNKGVDWLLADRTSTNDDKSRQVLLEAVGVDILLRGWPWLPGQADWLEPTALAMLALASAPQTQAIETRLAEGIRFLENRRCRDGGWNFGTPVMLGTKLPPRVVPTALALLAMLRCSPERDWTQDAVALRSQMHIDASPLALGWGLLALHMLGQDDPDSGRRLAEQEGPKGGWNNNPYCTAVAHMALQGGPWPGSANAP